MKSGFMRPSRQKVLADLWSNKTRTLLVVASIAVGVFAIGAIASDYVILSEDISISYASAQPANIEVITDPFDDNLDSGFLHEGIKFCLEGSYLFLSCGSEYRHCFTLEWFFFWV